MTLKERFLKSDFHRVFNFQGDINIGRTLNFLNGAMANIGNAVITGALYTAFLAENGIDIVRVGIISFIPYISWMLSVFSPTILSHFRYRQKLLLLNDWIYYGTIVFATTIMPLFVDDPGIKTVLFAVFVFIGNMSNALLGSGYTAWLIRFVPTGKDLNVYVSWCNRVNVICSNLTGILASFAATWIAARGNQFWFLFWLRMAAFVMFIINNCMVYLIPRETPAELSPTKIRPIHVLTVPVKYKKFLLTAMITVAWNITVNLNASTYSYYLLETVKLPMAYIYVGSVSGMFASFFLAERFRKRMDKTSPFAIISLFAGVSALLELFYIFVAPGRAALYVTLIAITGVVNVGFATGYGALFYLHIPSGTNHDLFATFWNLAGNISAFIGAALGTWILAGFEAHGVYSIMGMEFHGSQLLCAIKLMCYFATFLFVVKTAPMLRTKDE